MLNNVNKLLDAIQKYKKDFLIMKDEFIERCNDTRIFVKQLFQKTNVFMC